MNKGYLHEVSCKKDISLVYAMKDSFVTIFKRILPIERTSHKNVTPQLGNTIYRMSDSNHWVGGYVKMFSLFGDKVRKRVQNFKLKPEEKKSQPKIRND